jgi:hypothetical protein
LEDWLVLEKGDVDAEEDHPAHHDAHEVLVDLRVTGDITLLLSLNSQKK